MLTVGLGKARDSWPADLVRRAAGTAARSLNGTAEVVSTLAGLPGEPDEDVVAAAVEGLLL
ncbi:M17 family peptidase N-terminal domain-containing protein, partial [Mycolicibacter sinensis]|uniref:M17 family peptidase N-terminal domain-containing protein n=1 Tax=Mycolicibacter sinensis (strain JDM601) TaxID=875328 RepID=UPI000B25262D